MHIALLFNSDDPEYGGYYGSPIRRKVFNTRVLQASGRHMKMAVGDVLTFGKARTKEGHIDLCERVYFQNEWSLLHPNRLRATFLIATVYALTFENMTKEIATTLHDVLSPDKSYLGLQAVTYSYGPHLALFRNSMIPKYRIIGTSCRIFIHMNEEDEKDLYEPAELKSEGFVDVDWEDSGARNTIFDNFDTLEHFQQVELFRKAVTPFLNGGEDDAYELTMLLEDLNPQLFNSLGSAIKALNRAQHEEDIAQAALSGRRYMERMADVLFPARETPHSGRKVGQAEFRNRLWAFIEENASNQEQLQTLGKEVDRLVKEFNSGLHSENEQARVLHALADMAKLSASLLGMNPNVDPYYAYRKAIIDFGMSIIKITSDVSKKHD